MGLPIDLSMNCRQHPISDQSSKTGLSNGTLQKLHDVPVIERLAEHSENSQQNFESALQICLCMPETKGVSRSAIQAPLCSLLHVECHKLIPPDWIDVIKNKTGKRR